MAQPPSLILLPGMDGTGDLFRSLLAVVPPTFRTRIISYPPNKALSYTALLDLLVGQLSDERDIVLVAESFSGPLAIRYAAAHPAHVRAVILCATFISLPVPRFLRHLCTPLLQLPIPTAAVRLLLTGRSAPDALVQEVRQAIRRVRPHVLAHRLREVLMLSSDGQPPRPCPMPMLYLAASHDALVPSSCIEAVRRAYPQMQVQTVDGPHLLLQARPQAAWREMERFVIALAESHRGRTDQKMTPCPRPPDFPPADVMEVLHFLADNGILVWVDGGWGVDALLGEQTRPHADLDIALQHKDVPKLRELLEERGYRDVPRDDTRDCNFVLGDDAGHLVDVHSYTLDSHGKCVFGLPYPADSLTGTGTINGYPVRCISAQWMVNFHTGYELDENDYHDVLALSRRFGIAMPREYDGFTRTRG